MAVSAVQRLALLFTVNPWELWSIAPHTGLRLGEAYDSESGTPVPLSFLGRTAAAMTHIAACFPQIFWELAELHYGR